MPRQVIGVIGALSEDTIHITRRSLAPGSTVPAKQTRELGGRAVNIAIAISRCCRKKPNTSDGLLPEDHVDDDDEVPEVRMVGAVVSDERKAEFSKLLRQNGVDPSGVEVVEGEETEQDNLTSIFESKVARSQQLNSAGVSQNWTKEHFDKIEKLGGGMRPDLLVVTMELSRDVIEHIVDHAHEEGVDVLVYASPGAVLLADHYRKIEHLIGSEGDVAVILGYEQHELKDEQGDLRVEVCPEMCKALYSHKRFKNVVIKSGYYGAFFKNEEEEDGFASGYQNKNDVTDSSGST